MEDKNAAVVEGVRRPLGGDPPVEDVVVVDEAGREAMDRISVQVFEFILEKEDGHGVLGGHGHGERSRRTICID